jgi:drug/metabolite transporter (DMT)-like permease
MSILGAHRRRSSATAYLLLTLTALAWGANAVAGRMAVDAISPMLLTMFRWLFAFLALALIIPRELAAHADVLKRHFLYVLVMGAAGFTGFNAFSYSAAHHTTAVNIAIIQGAMPALILLGALVVYRIPIRRVQLLGSAAALVGVTAIASRGDLAALGALSFNFGDLLMFAGALLYSGYAVALRQRPAIPAVVFFAGLSAAAFVTSLPLVAHEVMTGSVLWPTLKGWAIVAFTTLFPSLMAQVFFILGIELIGAGRAGSFVNLVPVFGALLAVVILAEPFMTYHALALTLVLTGILLSQEPRRASRANAEEQA